MNKNIKCILTGIAAGTVNGLLGSGGGAVVVPLFLSMGIDEKKTFATTVFTMLPLCLVSACVYLMMGGFTTENQDLWDIIWPYLAGGLAGGIAGGLLFSRVKAVWLKRSFGALLIFAGAKMLFQL